jgi:hypothetical protein
MVAEYVLLTFFVSYVHDSDNKSLCDWCPFVIRLLQTKLSNKVINTAVKEEIEYIKRPTYLVSQSKAHFAEYILYIYIKCS